MVQAHSQFPLLYTEARGRRAPVIDVVDRRKVLEIHRNRIKALGKPKVNDYYREFPPSLADPEVKL